MKTKNVFKIKYLARLFMALLAVTAAYVGYMYPTLSMAALYNAVVTGGDTDTVYVPSYEATPGEQGVIEVKAKAETKPFDSLSFVMSVSPASALTFKPDAILFDSQTLFQNASVKTVNVKQPGTIEVTVVLTQPVSVTGAQAANPQSHKTLFKLNTQVANNLTEGQQVAVSFKDFAAKNGPQAMDFPPLPATTLTIKAAPTPPNSGKLANTSLTSVSPQQLSNKTEGAVSVVGQNLDVVKKVWVGKNPVEISSQTATSLTLKIPANLPADIYDLVLFDDLDQSVSFNDKLTLSEAEPVPVESVSPDAPQFVLDRTYTNPTSVLNDGKTPFTLYAFVEDKDIKSVAVDLSTVGQVGPENAGVLGEEEQIPDLKNLTCPSTSSRVVCMKPSIKEGKGQWFILTDLTASSALKPSSTPYEVDALAVDLKGNTTSAKLPIIVGSKSDSAVLKALAAVPTSETTLEILFNKALDPESVSESGEGFALKDSTAQSLEVQEAALDATGKIVTLTLASQKAGETYLLSLPSELQDKQGKSLSESQATLSFEGFLALNKAPILDYLSALDNQAVELEFQNNLQLSALLDLKVTLYEAENPQNKLELKSIQPVSSKVIRLQTQTQLPEKRYRIEIENLKSYDGTALPIGINRGFKGYTASLIHQAATKNAADLNQDGRVDFADFTIFSSVYGTVYEGGASNLKEEVESTAKQQDEAQTQGFVEVEEKSN